MAFIEAVPAHDSDGEVRKMYERQQAHYGYVPNYAKVFCHRPEVMRLWADLLAGIKRPMDKRRYELVTFAAANALRSTLCSLAHGKVLTEFFSVEDVQLIAKGQVPKSLSTRSHARWRVTPSALTSTDVERLKHHGVTDAEVFDIAAAAAARAFWTKVIESLGVEADASFQAMDSEFRKTLTVGRPIDFEGSQRSLETTG